MLEILKFTFDSFWIWLGMVILLWSTTSVFRKWIYWMATVIKEMIRK